MRNSFPFLAKKWLRNWPPPEDEVTGAHKGIGDTSADYDMQLGPLSQWQLASGMKPVCDGPIHDAVEGYPLVVGDGLGGFPDLLWR